MSTGSVGVSDGTQQEGPQPIIDVLRAIVSKVFESDERSALLAELAQYESVSAKVAEPAPEPETPQQSVAPVVASGTPYPDPRDDRIAALEAELAKVREDAAELPPIQPNVQ